MKALNDKLMLTDILTHLKDIMQLMCTGLKESNCEKMRALLTKQSNTTATLQFKLFKYMNENGMYPVKNALPAELKQQIDLHSKWKLGSV